MIVCTSVPIHIHLTVIYTGLPPGVLRTRRMYAKGRLAPSRTLKRMLFLILRAFWGSARPLDSPSKMRCGQKPKRLIGQVQDNINSGVYFLSVVFARKSEYSFAITCTVHWSFVNSPIQHIAIIHWSNHDSPMLKGVFCYLYVLCYLLPIYVFVLRKQISVLHKQCINMHNNYRNNCLCRYLLAELP